MASHEEPPGSEDSVEVLVQDEPNTDTEEEFELYENFEKSKRIKAESLPVDSKKLNEVQEELEDVKRDTSLSIYTYHSEL